MIANENNPPIQRSPSLTISVFLKNCLAVFRRECALGQLQNFGKVIKSHMMKHNVLTIIVQNRGEITIQRRE